MLDENEVRVRISWSNEDVYHNKQCVQTFALRETQACLKTGKVISRVTLRFEMWCGEQ